MSETADGNHGSSREPDVPTSRGIAVASAGRLPPGPKNRGAPPSSTVVAIPFRAMERNEVRGEYSAFASPTGSSCALPFDLIVVGALGSESRRFEDAVASGGLPQAIVNAIGDVARAADSNSWWLLLTGVPLLLWEGYTGARALQLIFARLGQPPPRSRPLRARLRLRGMCLFVGTIMLTWWLRDWTQLGQLGVVVLMVGPWPGYGSRSRSLPHGSARWTALLPGAIRVAVGFQVTHGLVVYLLGPKLETSMSLYGALGVLATVLFFMWVIGRIVVTAPILNSALHDELSGRHQGDGREPVLSRTTLRRVSRRMRSGVG